MPSGEKANTAAVFTLTMKYKEGFSDPKRDVLDPQRVVVPRLPGAIISGGFAFEALPEGWKDLYFLHPVLETIQYSSSTCKDLLFKPFHLMEDIRTRWDRPLDLVPLTEWILVRTVSNPCDFSVNGLEAKSLQYLWQGFVVAAQGNQVPVKDSGNQKRSATSSDSPRVDL